MAEDKEDGNIGSFYMGRVRPPPEPKRFLPPGVLTLIALAVLGGIVWYAYPRSGVHNTDVPVIRANTASIKSKPANPGGMKIPYQHSTAFNPLVDNGGQTTGKLMPSPAQPVNKVAAIKAAQSKMPAPPKLDMQVKQVGNGVEKLVPPPPTAHPPVTVGTITPHKAESPKIVFSLQPKAAAKKTVTKKVAAKKILTKKSVAKKYLAKKAVAHKKAAMHKAIVKKSVAHKAAAASAGAKKFMVQLGSYRARADAKAYWARTRPQFAPTLRHLRMRIVRADIRGRGIYYRLQAGPVSRGKGNAICDVLKAGRRPCILTRR